MSAQPQTIHTLPANLKPDTLIANPEGRVITGTATLNAPAADVWNIVGNFAGFAVFIDGLVFTEMTGSGIRSVRRKIFNDGNLVLEQLNSWDGEAMQMTWSLIYTTFNIGNLWAAMRVEPISDNSCKVYWDISGEPWEGGPDAQPAFESFIEGFLAMAMGNLEKLFNH